MKPDGDDDELLAEYDLAEGVRGKYFERYRQGTNVVLLDPDVCWIRTWLRSSRRPNQ